MENEEVPMIYGFSDKVSVRIFDGKCGIDFSLVYEDIRFIDERE